MQLVGGETSLQLIQIVGILADRVDRKREAHRRRVHAAKQQVHAEPSREERAVGNAGGGRRGAPPKFVRDLPLLALHAGS